MNRASSSGVDPRGSTFTSAMDGMGNRDLLRVLHQCAHRLPAPGGCLHPRQGASLELQDKRIQGMVPDVSGRARYRNTITREIVRALSMALVLLVPISLRPCGTDTPLRKVFQRTRRAGQRKGIRSTPSSRNREDGCHFCRFHITILTCIVDATLASAMSDARYSDRFESMVAASNIDIVAHLSVG